jgi:hypothetical protein
MNKENDTSRFTIQDEKEEIPDSIYAADAENLRIEKLSTRVTLVAVLIPCLLVIVLAVAYLDIKNRVVSTQNTGTIGVQNLSKDLESRFSSLSLKQAKLEEELAGNTKTLETATAALQIKIKKSIAEFKNKIESKANQSDLTALAKKNADALGALKKDVADLNASFAKFDEELAGQILLMAEGLKKDQERLAAVEKKTQQLDAEKLSKESLNLSLGLERLALQELVKDKIREVEKKLARMDKQIDTLGQQWKTQTKQHTSPPPPAVTSPAPVAPSSPPSPAAPSKSSGIEEQTIN